MAMQQISRQINVLLIDDDEDDYLIVKNVMSKIQRSPFILTWQQDYDEGHRIIEKNEHDIYLIDYRLGARTGLELLASTEPQKRAQPFIILTGAGDERIERLAMQLGAADYLVKGTFNAELLSRTLRYGLQRKLIEQQRVSELIAINKAKDEFISVASHQLRTPATGVKQYIGMVLEGYAGDITDPQREMLEKAYESNERQLQIVSNLLRVAQVDAGKVRLRRSDVPLIQLIDDIITEQAVKFSQRSQNVEFTKPPYEVAVHIDKAHFRMVLENIIDNASKYSPASTTVRVGLTIKDKNAVITVSDQGVGIKESDQDRLFEKFFRIENSLSTLVGGTGLGLYWAKKIVDLHGGTIKVTSSEGKGTTFTITAPCSQ